MGIDVESPAASRDATAPSKGKENDSLRRLFHDMRTPLNVVIGMTDLLLRGEVAPGSPQHDEFLGDILGAGRRLLELVNTFSTAASGADKNADKNVDKNADKGPAKVATQSADEIGDAS